jgi:O-antigen/teichoic acid export membrane protein
VFGTLGISVPSVLLLIVLGRPLARVWVGAQLLPSVGLLAAFAVWTVYSLAMTQVSFLLNAAQVVGPQVIMALSMTAANLGLSLYLTRHVGITGPLIGSLAAHIVFSGVPAVMLAVRVLRRPSSTAEEGSL